MNHLHQLILEGYNAGPQKIVNLLAILDVPDIGVLMMVNVFKHSKNVQRNNNCARAASTNWDDVRTYLTSSIDSKEKAALIVAIAHFKKEVEQ